VKGKDWLGEGVPNRFLKLATRERQAGKELHLQNECIINVKSDPGGRKGEKTTQGRIQNSVLGLRSAGFLKEDTVF